MQHLHSVQTVRLGSNRDRLRPTPIITNADVLRTRVGHNHTASCHTCNGIWRVAFYVSKEPVVALSAFETTSTQSTMSCRKTAIDRIWICVFRVLQLTWT